MPTQKDQIEIGQVYHYLTITEKPYREKKGRYTQWRVTCCCKCGIKKDVRVRDLFAGTVKSCGCYNRIAAGERMATYNKKYDVDITHPLYNSWTDMKRACYNPKRDNYLGGEIVVCEDWKNDYECFYHWGIQNGWEPNLGLTRKNKTQNFTPNNCHFISRRVIIMNNANPDKVKQTCMHKYGVASYTKTPECQAKIRATSRKKYGTDYPVQSQEVRDKIDATNLQRYGTKYPMQTQEIKDKIAATCMEKYGVKSPSQCPAIRQKQIDTTMAKYGTPFYHTANCAQQNEVRDWLSSYDLQFSANYKILQGKEIDLYNADLQLGIEYCGLHWHHEHSKEPRRRLYHYNKYNKCREAGVRLMTIFSDEWLKKQDQVKNFLRAVVGKNQRVFARKCTAEILDRKTGKTFMEQHHIQGQKRAAAIYFGLQCDDQLVGAMSLNRHHRQGNDVKRVVLDRLAFADGISVVGGASKLLKLAKGWCVTNDFSQIVSWSDNRWSCGGVYEKMGFVLETELVPDYAYVRIANPRERISKQQMTKKKIGCPSDMTEHEHALQLGFARIWDCGKRRYVFSI